jgi:hypothetical protein
MLEHKMEWATSFLEQHSKIDKFNQVREIMPPYPGFARFNKQHSQVKKWSGKEMEGHVRMIVHVVPATHLNSSASQWIHFTEALLWVKDLLYIHLITQY